jgi:hypothetical protein
MGQLYTGERYEYRGKIAGLVIGTVATILCQALALGAPAEGKPSEPGSKATVGAYYFDGWAGRNAHADDPNEPWATNAPTHLTRRMIEEFPEREPIWGWRDDAPAVMERQIDLAADHGVNFFAFCWYWHDNGQALNEQAVRADPLHTGLELFLKARNRHRLKFCLLVANHAGFEIKGTTHWTSAADYWMPYLQHPQYLTVGGKPLLIIFHPQGGDQAGFAYLQGAARKAGLPGVALAGCGGGSAEMGYTHRTHYNIIPGYSAGPEMRPYAELLQAHREAWKGSRELPYLPTVTAGWDKRPWEGPHGLNQQQGWYFPGRTPEQFADFLRDAIQWMDQHAEETTAERIVLIYAWNEFGEGGYIAPTRGDPQGGYLNALRSALDPAGVKLRAAPSPSAKQ